MLNDLQAQKRQIDEEIVQIKRRNSERRPLRYWPLGIFLALAVLIVQGIIMAQVYLPETVFKYTVPVLQVINSPVHRGDRLQYKVEYCKYIDSGSTVTFQVTGPTLFQLPAVTSNLPVGCATETFSNISLPANMMPGTYHVQVTNIFVVNGFRTVAVRNVTTDFIVLP